MPRKTFTLQPPKVPDELLPHFWRGMLDGDGYIGIIYSGSHAPTIKISLTGTFEMTNAFALFVRRFAATRTVPYRRKGKNSWQIDFRGKQLPKLILHELYDSATVYLDRKQKNVEKILALESVRPSRTNLQDGGEKCRAV